MRFYTVHLRPARPAEDPDVVLVKEGFCWPALFVPAVWAAWHKLWLGLVLYLAVGFALAAAAAVLDLGDEAELLLALAYAVLVAAHANDWRRRSLARRGYRFDAVVAARNRAEAEQRYFADRPPPRRPGPAATLPGFAP